jgi:dipeptidyl aminopeptidase/acylaminoacyl peptidase
MRKKSFIIMIIVSTAVVLLLLPLIFKSKSSPRLVGPDLSEFKYTEIFFKNQQAGIRLSGMLFLPEENGTFPAAVIIHGSGTSRRNSVWYLSVTRHLLDNGIAVLLPDKRGSEKSGGHWVGADFEELATDTLSAVEFLKNQNRFEYSTIGLIGMSQGGWIAPVAAGRTEDISWVVSLSGSTTTTDEQLLHEEIHNLSSYTYTFIARLIAPITSNMIKKRDYFKPLAGFDPIPRWKRLKVPVFFAFGEKDSNVPVQRSLTRLDENGLGHHKIKVYPEGGHAIRDAQNRVSREFLNDMVRFINAIRPGRIFRPGID